MRPPFPSLCGLAVLIAFAASPAAAAPLITEFLTNNNSGILDEDNTRQDWIEIHNPDLVAVDLGGYHLTDDLGLPMRWTFPSGVLVPPGGYLVVFASGKNRTVAGQPLHTNFGLASGGEYLALNEPGGLVHLSEWNEFPVQSADVSYGLLAPTAGSASVFFTTPTPGATNSAATAPAEAVVLTPPSRTFNSGTTLNVALSVTSPTATVRYTTNRSRPIGVTGVTGNFTADAATDVATMTAHGLSAGDMVRVSGPAPLVTTVNYFVTVLSADTFKLAIEPSGTPIDLTASGTFVIRRDAFTATAAVSDYFSTPANHTFLNGDPVQVSTTGTLPAGITAGTTYYIVYNAPTSFRLSASPTLTPVVDVTSTGTGIHTVFRIPSPAYAGPIPVTINTRVRARAFESGRPPGPVAGEMYYAIDAAAQAFTSPLPVVVSHTWNTGMANDVVIDGHVMIFEPKAPDNLTRLTNMPDLAAPCTLERRGSSTAGDPKYSMAVEMQDENGLDRNYRPLGMPGESDWIMHAPYQFDRSMMHNDLIYRLSNDAGRYAVRTKHIEHYHNVQTATNTIEGSTTGTDYFGVYSFMEKITRGNNRVDVENLTIADNTVPAVQGGYIFKVDRLDPGETGIRPLAGQSFGNVGTMGPGNNIMAWVNPREISNDPFKKVTTAQSNWLRGHIGEAWAALSGPNFNDPLVGYAKYWDVEALIDHQWLNIMAKNADANRLSAYWHKPRFGKITAGPIWDFDRAEGSTDGRDFNWGTWRGDVGDLGTDFFHYPWYNEMFRDPNFWQQFIDRFHMFRQGPWSTAAVHARIDEFAAQLNPGDAANTPAKRSAIRWSASAPRGAGSNTAITNNTFNGLYTGEIAWLKHWWASRLNFIDGQFSRPPVANPALPPQPMPNPVTVGLTSPTLATPGAKIYYTLDGTDPRAQQLPVVTSIAANYVTQTTPVKALVPTAATNVTAWRGGNEPFDDSAWQASPASPVPTFTGVGYDPGPGTVDFRPFFNTSITVTMQNVNTSCFVRYAFTVPPGGLAGINFVRLKMRYDDGFHAFLNGTSLASRLSPAEASLAWNSATPGAATHDDTAATQQENIDVLLSTLPANTLREGVNILAIHGLNANATSSDFLIQAELEAGSQTNPSPGEFTPGAVEYTGPLNITQPTTIFARTRHPNPPSDPPTTGGGGTGTVPNGSRFSAPLVLHIFPGAEVASPVNITITEVHYHPSPPAPDEIANGWTNSNDFEFIRLTNTGNAPVDLTGIYFSNGLEFTAVPGLQNWLPAGASVIVVENAAAFTYRYGSTFTVLGEFKGELDDGGEHIVLNDKTGAVISDFIYGDDAPWPESADDGYSLLYVSGSQNLAASWRASLDPGGTSVNTYARWLRRYYINSDHPSQQMSQDDDGDGLNNLGEYAFATDPLTAGSAEQSRGVMVAGVPPGLSVRRRTGTTDLTWIFETTADLTTGSWTPSGAPPVSVVNNGDGTETVTWQAAAAPGATRLYMRVRVTSP